MSKPIYDTNEGSKRSDLKTKDEGLDSQSNSNRAQANPISKSGIERKKSFSERWRTNRFWLVRGSYVVLNSIWMAVMAIGAFIAWVIAMLFI